MMIIVAKIALMRIFALVEEGWLIFSFHNPLHFCKFFFHHLLLVNGQIDSLRVSHLIHQTSESRLLFSFHVYHERNYTVCKHCNNYVEVHKFVESCIVIQFQGLFFFGGGELKAPLRQ